MAWKNFIPTVWAEEINRDLEKNLVFAADTNREYEGKVKNKGDQIKILGIGKVTIHEGERKDANGNIVDPEQIDDQSALMPINQFAYFNYLIDDIDEAQSRGGYTAALQAETSEGLADKIDNYIAKLALKKEAVKLKPTSGTFFTLTKENILEVLDEALIKLSENDVKVDKTYIVATMPARAVMLLKQAKILTDTDNSKFIEAGYSGRYGKVVIKQSNNVAKDESGVFHIMVRTKRAIAYAKPVTHLDEPYRPHNRFSDALKGFILYDAKIVRPKELVVIPAKF